MKQNKIEIVNASDPYDTHAKGLLYDKLKKRHDELVEALETIKDAFWSEDEPLQDRIADLKSIAKQALKNDI